MHVISRIFVKPVTRFLKIQKYNESKLQRGLEVVFYIIIIYNPIYAYAQI